ncbi:MAG: cysteine desulfurase CsdA [Candidatus Marinimicrobia bacterium]|nr:cysteine desulfurase CsdA [Candidatus Neomarinimicrobiota bacterium]|tara:strand:+ start:8133 stop:9341 length:1209 start_codon:yes stop_codon:yes gene_type:complete
MKNIKKIRQDFPFFNHNPDMIYFDNAATTHKPNSVIESISKYYSYYNSNVHRGIYKIAEKATHEFELTRDVVKDFIGSKNRESIIFTSGATESINLVAHGWGKHHLSSGDHILLSQMEHHSNIVPWHMIAKNLGLNIDFIPIADNGELDLSHIDQLITSKTKLISIVHQSNVLGTINPIKTIIKKAHEKGALVLIDGAQSVAHQEINVIDLDCDFFVFSGHKIYGPTGVGVLYSKLDVLNQMQPIVGGGEMIKEVTNTGFTLNHLPWRFEAGTPPISEVIALKEAIKYIQELGVSNIFEYENKLIKRAENQLLDIKGIKIYSPNKNKGPTIAFNIDNIHSYDLTKVLDEMKVAIRSGHHCAQPLMDTIGISSSNRISLSFYNTLDEIDNFISKINKSLDILI